ncbi:MAG: CopD family protein, partial [Sphingomonadaceae bacterium]
MASCRIRRSLMSSAWLRPSGHDEDALMLIEWIKAFHVMAVISWMAGMLYLPRLMVY